jgi:hypothetical protein
MTDRELMQMALDALEAYPQGWRTDKAQNVMDALRDRLAQPEPEPVAWVENLTDPQPHAVTDLKYCSVAQRESGEDLKYVPLYAEVCTAIGKVDEPVVFNTLSSLRHKKTVGPIESVMTGRPQTAMQPCAGRNCGSTNPNLHSAECFEDYEKSAGMRKWVGLTDEEIKALASWWPSYEHMPALMTLARDIENSLKEKNT